METRVHPLNDEFIAFLFHWLDTPNTLVSTLSRGFGDFLLCELLEERLGAGLVLETWTLETPFEDPADALDVVTRRFGISFGSSSQPDFFGTQFTLALSFLNDSRYGFKRLGSLLAKKLGGVFAAGVWELGDVLTFQRKKALCGLSAEYYLVALAGQPVRVEITIDCEGDTYSNRTVCPINRTHGRPFVPRTRRPQRRPQRCVGRAPS